MKHSICVMLLWLSCRSDESRVGKSRTHVAKPHIFTPRVRADLSATGMCDNAPIDVTSTPHVWSEYLSPFENKIVGLAFARPKSVTSVTEFLNEQVREVHDYWLMTDFRSDPLVYVDIVECVMVGEETSWQQRFGVPSGATLFSEMTPFSLDSVRAKGTEQGNTFEAVVNYWAQKHDLRIRDFIDANGALTVRQVMALPIAHALLCATKQWSTWGFPLLFGRQRRGHPYNVGKPLWGPYDVQGRFGIALHDPFEVHNPFGPADMTSISLCT